MNLFYYASQVYQYSFAKPIYQRLGGTFIVTNLKKRIRFKRFMRNGNVFPEIRTFLNTPPVATMDIKNLTGMKGIIISQSNARIVCDHDRCKTIFMGHGTGDKKYGGDPKKLESYDYHFVSGRKHLEKLKDVGVKIDADRLIKIGNPRFDEYVGGEIDRDRYLDTLGIVDRERKTVLYAPTWRWGNGTLHTYVYRFCHELTGEFNLIVRPHYFEANYIPIMKAWTRLRGIKHVYFSDPRNILVHDTMNDFAVSDLLISDTSSIAYEYLITLKPTIIIQSKFPDLHSMPPYLDIRSVAQTYTGSAGLGIRNLALKTLSDQSRKEDYHHLLSNCFYFNDGHSTDRAVNYISKLKT
ncbi:MAG: CDP-glycerol glycerophosphotransferase family protein [Fidelibacterota bacterium]